MNLYTDDNPHTTLKGLGYKDKLKALETIVKVEKYFNEMSKKQVVPGWSPNNVLPKVYLNSYDEVYKYYRKQKMYRILGMLNRARGMINRIKDETRKKNMKEAMEVFDKWMKKYKVESQKGGGLVDCCLADENNNKKCVRKSDNKEFTLPRKWSRKRCQQGFSGFTMKSSCAPFNDCL